MFQSSISGGSLKAAYAYLIMLGLITSCSGDQDGRAVPIGTFIPEQSKEYHIADFDGLFLTHTPMRYQDCHSFLFWLEHDADPDGKEKRLVCSKLKTFLDRRPVRPLAPDSHITSTAPPETILRIYAVRLLGRFGTSEDLPFLENLRGERLNFVCAESIKRIRERVSIQQPLSRALRNPEAKPKDPCRS